MSATLNCCPNKDTSRGAVGVDVAAAVGCKVGLVVDGDCVGAAEGARDGGLVGLAVEDVCVGSAEGAKDRGLVGLVVISATPGLVVGWPIEGERVGHKVGAGMVVGSAVSFTVVVFVDSSSFPSSSLEGARLGRVVGTSVRTTAAQDSNRSGQQQNLGHVKFWSCAMPMLTKSSSGKAHTSAGMLPDNRGFPYSVTSTRLVSLDKAPGTVPEKSLLCSSKACNETSVLLAFMLVALAVVLLFLPWSKMLLEPCSHRRRRRHS